MGQLLLSTLVVTLWVHSINTSPVLKCRCLPKDPCWPDTTAWDRFNTTLGGRLLATFPPAYPCHDPHYDEAACNVVKKQWNNPLWRIDQAGAMQYETWEVDNNANCSSNTNRTSPCHQGSIPEYSVDVSDRADIQHAVRFAANNRLRLTVKNTGHDFLGRSTAPGSLSIWTHHLKNITFHESFDASGCTKGVSAVTLGAGVEWGEAYEAVSKHNMEIVGGQSFTVGAAGGYAQGGGHSPLGPKYGMRPDNVLQMEVVTADGELRIANACQNKDLFWALCGGGGGTFGVVTSVTYRTYPSNRYSGAIYNVQIGNASYQDLLRDILLLQPALSDAGCSSAANASFQQHIASLVQKHPGALFTGKLQDFPTYLDWLRSAIWLQSPDPAGNCTIVGGDNILMGSRLIPRSNLESKSSATELARVLLQTMATLPPNSPLGLGLLGGGEVARNGGINAVNPAWRKSLLHTLYMISWPENSSNQKQNEVASDITRVIQPLRDLIPDSGCYANEADPNEPNWQQAFYGDNYSRLKTIKNQVDPTGLFVCRKCVGSEDWSEDLNCPRYSISQ
ncbi:uncharacterized protein VTP21DRAFT_9096 [Calcarisporiella thermophila]|uniref:uncharacterized protein n=1 Tax=Calcarisporiella thermophila TaxID=911321 RepID=UPI0037445780